jgi:hypothetical protein
MGLKLNLAHQLLVYADDVNLMEDYMDTIKTNIAALIGDSKKVCLEENVENFEYMLTSHHQNSGQNHNTKIVNISFENLAKLKYFGKTVTEQILFH